MHISISREVFSYLQSHFCFDYSRPSAYWINTDYNSYSRKKWSHFVYKIWTCENPKENNELAAGEKKTNDKGDNADIDSGNTKIM